jgi:hypothetical protein
MELAQLSHSSAHLQRPMAHPSLPGDRQNKLLLNAHWTEHHMKIVGMERMDDGEKIMFKMVVVFFLSGEQIRLVTWGALLNMLGL